MIRSLFGVLVFILLLILLYLIRCVVVNLIGRHDLLEHGAVEMRAKAFRDLWELAPDAWTVTRMGANRYVVDEEDTGSILWYPEPRQVYVTYPVRDYFRAWNIFMDAEVRKEQAKERRQEKDQAKAHKLLLLQAQKEINQLLDQSEKEIREAQETIAGVAENLKEEDE